MAAPTAGELYLFREQSGAADFIGCLGGPTNFGRALATGVVLGDDSTPDLAVTDERLVYVLDGQKLAELPEASSVNCSLGALPEGALISSFTCGSTDDIEGCDVSRFGETLAIGDLDGDGDGELAVGAPGMTVRGESNAGAVLVWDLEAPGEIEFTEAEIHLVGRGERPARLISRAAARRRAEYHRGRCPRKCQSGPVLPLDPAPRRRRGGDRYQIARATSLVDVAPLNRRRCAHDASGA